jgi:hypothetical protein
MTQDTSFAITNDTNWNMSPSIYGDSIVWASPDGIHLWYRGNTIRLYDDPNLYEQYPVISKDLIAWFAEDMPDPLQNDRQIRFYLTDFFAQ